MRWIGFPIRLVLCLFLFPFHAMATLMLIIGFLLFAPHNLSDLRFEDIKESCIDWKKWVLQ